MLDSGSKQVTAVSGTGRRLSSVGDGHRVANPYRSFSFLMASFRWRASGLLQEARRLSAGLAAGAFSPRRSSYGRPVLSMTSMVTANLRATATLALRRATFPPRAQMRSPWRLRAMSGELSRRCSSRPSGAGGGPGRCRPSISAWARPCRRTGPGRASGRSSLRCCAPFRSGRDTRHGRHCARPVAHVRPLRLVPADTQRVHGNPNTPRGGLQGESVNWWLHAKAGNVPPRGAERFARGLQRVCGPVPARCQRTNAQSVMGPQPGMV
jgi:hypothetical protein